MTSGPTLLSPAREDARRAWLAPGIAIGAGAIATGSLLWLASGELLLPLAFAGGMAGIGSTLVAMAMARPRAGGEGLATPDWSVTCAVAQRDDQALAVTDRAGRLVCANQAFSEWMGGGDAPPRLPFSGSGAEIVAAAGRAAWRDGHATIGEVAMAGHRLAGDVERVGRGEDHLVWRFSRLMAQDLVGQAGGLVSGLGGRALSRAGIQAVVVSPEGRIIAANSAFSARAIGDAGSTVAGRDLAELLRVDGDNRVRYERDAAGAPPLALYHIPITDADPADLQDGEDPPPALFVLVDDLGAGLDPGAALGRIEALVGTLPLGLAMIDRDGRFLFANPAFARALGVEPDAMPVYPADLVVKDDKAAVSDTVRRFAVGQAHAGDLAVRLKSAPDEPVAFSLAGVRGLGPAAVLLSIKDSSEENRLKRQVAQATKMQAVGQLAGGVAHDFNNVLTAILGICDLMLLRHSPGDSDYDDIQQIRSNSNRAASLTRQLLAFSRQQTLRPQVLQLPDVISEVSHLLKRLLGEKVVLEVSHDRDLGAVRADPGQLEQVIVNLAVNARDAMLARADRGLLKLATRRITASDVRAMNSEFMPVGDYTALVVEDSGTGIPPDVIGKIFEPFFTTKEVGKGTGLGLSTVYGIVKQSGGYIFAENVPGSGARFTIYLPVHAALPGEAGPAAAVPEPARTAASWGTGHILLVEDEDMVRAVAERALTRQGYTVTTASHGEEGLEAISGEGPFDLVVSDVVMPGMDGPAMARAIRERHPGMPILFMSGYAEEQLRQSIDLPGVHFLPKPFTVTQIVEAAARAMA